MHYLQIGFVALCFAGGCAMAAGTAKKQGMLRMEALWQLISVVSLLTALVLGGIGLFQLTR